MTDKEIIIDSIDIRKCKHFEALHESRPNGFGGITIENYCYLYEDNCEKYPQCLYRSNRLQQLETQLQREKQNSQEAIDTSIKEFNRAEELKTLLKRKEQECEKLYIQLKADEEYHKEEENTLRKIIKNKEERNIELYKENNKLKQTLTEIKEICSEMDCESLMQNSWCGNTDFKMGCCEKVFKKQILQKISESEVNNER